MQILSIDLGTDMLPALGLGTEMPEQGIMDRPPRSTKETLLNKRLILLAFFWYGLIESTVSLGAYFFVNIMNGWPNVPLAASGLVYQRATTMALASIVFCQIGVVLCARTEKQSLFQVGFFSNKNIVKGIIFEILLVSAIIYVPFMQAIFQTAPIELRDWVFLVLCPVAIVFLDEIRKVITRRIHRNKK
jgi:magnesium-transporting ATPase (P-type)